MNLLDGLEKLINEHGSATILKERIALANDRYSILEEKVAVLQKNNEALGAEKKNLQAGLEQEKQKVRRLEDELSKQNTSSNKFTETRGIKIKNLPSGGYDEFVPYCFHCDSPLSASASMSILECSKCGYKSSIQKRHFSCVISEIKGEKTPEWWGKRVP